jgi:hypothetical protein
MNGRKRGKKRLGRKPTSNTIVSKAADLHRSGYWSMRKGGRNPFSDQIR